ncbi:MAG: alpha/beta hydrolase [Ruminococcaceae bacterium]|nr:alpha/beta hydrolase [Oscillospiraceae bacterium]
MKYKVEKRYIPSAGRDIKILIFSPTQARKPAEDTPGILWIHGGGYATGMAEMAYISRPLALVKKYGAVVVALSYRLSGEAPYPAALEDCSAALHWLRDNADALGVNSSKLMVGGESAGGGLTAALCMYERDTQGVNIAFQMPIYPMIDDRDTDTSRDNHAPVWNTRRNHAAWRMYLRGLEEVPYWAAPARCSDYSGLPPAYTFVGDIEPFYCETLTYIDNLRSAGVEATVDVYSGWFHAYDMFMFFKKDVKEAIARFEKQYVYAAEHYSAPQRDCADE